MQEVLVDGIPISNLDTQVTNDAFTLSIPSLARSNNSTALQTYWASALKTLKGPPFVGAFYLSTEQKDCRFNVFTGGCINNVHMVSPIMKHVVYGLKMFKGQINVVWKNAFSRLLHKALAHESYNSLYDIEPLSDDGYTDFFDEFKNKMDSEFADARWFVMYETNSDRVMIGSDNICCEYPIITLVRLIFSNCSNRGTVPFVIDSTLIEQQLSLSVVMEDDTSKAEEVVDEILTFINYKEEEEKEKEKDKEASVAVAVGKDKEEEEEEEEEEDDGKPKAMEIGSDNEV